MSAGLRFLSLWSPLGGRAGPLGGNATPPDGTPPLHLIAAVLWERVSHQPGVRAAVPSERAE
jgi:hypothetical protein